jgi:polyhydroxybutyrate depolymerase
LVLAVSAVMLSACATLAPSTAAPVSVPPVQATSADGFAALTTAGNPVTLRQDSMRFGGLQREWMMAVPAHPVSKRLPLIVVLHGRGSTPVDEMQRSNLLTLVASGRAVEVYPAGVERSWNAGRCCGAAHSLNVDDVGFLNSLVRQLSSRADVNPQEVALVGFSNGGKMALRLACERTLNVPGVTLRGVAVVAAASVSDCTAGPSAPLVQLAGTHDPLVPYAQGASAASAGGRPLAPVLEEFGGWRAQAGCATPAIQTQAGTLQISTWSCRGGPMQLVTHPGGGHRWPPGAAQVIWQFLEPLVAPVSPLG